MLNPSGRRAQLYTGSGALRSPKVPGRKGGLRLAIKWNARPPSQGTLHFPCAVFASYPFVHLRQVPI